MVSGRHGHGAHEVVGTQHGSLCTIDPGRPARKEGIRHDEQRRAAGVCLHDEPRQAVVRESGGLGRLAGLEIRKVLPGPSSINASCANWLDGTKSASRASRLLTSLARCTRNARGNAVELR
jgi:hypothetical protein